MKILKVNQCCCGCSLRDGTPMIMFFYLGFHFLAVLLHTRYAELVVLNLVVYILVLGIPPLGIFGVFMKIPILLLPFMILQCSYSLLLVVLMFMAPFHTGLLIRESIIEYLPVLEEEMRETIGGRYVDEGFFEQATVDPIAMSPPDIIVVEILLIILIVTNSYLFIVVLSYYHEIKGQLLVQDRVTPSSTRIA